MNKKIDMILRDIKLGNIEKAIISIVLLVFVVTSMIPMSAKAQAAEGDSAVAVLVSSTPRNLLAERFDGATHSSYQVKREMKVTSTAYTSTVDQCDASPCITADGFNVCANGAENVLAANFLPFGTKVKIPELYGDRIFTVHDRMNKRFSNRVDIWMVSRNDAIQYGKRTIKIQILELEK